MSLRQVFTDRGNKAVHVTLQIGSVQPEHTWYLFTAQVVDVIFAVGKF